MTRAKSRTVTIAAPFATAIAGAPDIADVLPMSDRLLYIQGKKPGTTNVSIFGREKQLLQVIDIEVTADTAGLAQHIRGILGHNRIRVFSSQGQIVLSGTARDAVEAEKAVSLAKSVSNDIPIVNLLRIAQSQQVMLRVRFIEASRDAGRQLGINWFGSNQAKTRGVNTGLGTPTQAGEGTGGLPLFQAAGTLAGSTTAAPFGIALANLVNSKGASVDVLISALESKGLARRLAEPDLVALSGDSASFLAGGEIPIPVVQPSSGAQATITVDYKPFGVQLTFVPTVLADGIINLKLTPTVSELDYGKAIHNQGFLIPALSKREAKTTIELRDGQSFAIAGLLQTEGLRDISEVPWLGSVPVLGALFRSSSYQQNETDLVVIVTPYLVAPAAPGQRLATPLDSRLPGNDTDLFLNGETEVAKSYGTGDPPGFDKHAPYGHIITLPSP